MALEEVHKILERRLAYFNVSELAIAGSRTSVTMKVLPRYTEVGGLGELLAQTKDPLG